ncbi:MAG: PQQ-binding-like beta-propeller repeat protein [Vulcanimicrobiota bacterium]
MKRLLLILSLFSCGCKVQIKTGPHHPKTGFRNGNRHSGPVTTPPVPKESEPRKPTFLYHFDFQTGQERERKKTDPLPPGAAPTVWVNDEPLSSVLSLELNQDAKRSDGQGILLRVFSGALDTRKGKLLPLPSEQSVLYSLKDRVLVQDSTGQFACYTLPGLKQLWQLKTRSLQYRAADGNLLLFWGPETVVAIDLNSGKQLWEAPASIDRLSVGSQAVIVETQTPGQVVQIDRQNGKVLATVDCGAQSSDDISGGAYFGVRGEFGVKGFQVGSSQPLWARPKDDIWGSICADEERWYVQLHGDQDGLAAINWRTGKLDWCDTQAFARSGLVLHELLVLTPVLFRSDKLANGSYTDVPVKRCLQVRDRKSGRLLWYRVIGSPTIKIGEDNGQLWVWTPGKADKVGHGQPPKKP